MNVQVRIPKRHDAQAEVIDHAARFNVLSLGRRWGKTSVGADLACESALSGQPCGWFAPTYKLLEDAWSLCTEYLEPLIRRGIASANKTDRRIKLQNGGCIDFWTCDADKAKTAGRGRKYALVIVDEAAHVSGLEEAWTFAIRPTLADLGGRAWFLSTPFGHNYFHTLWSWGQDGEKAEWRSWQMPTDRNPYIPAEEIAAMRAEMPVDAVAQEVDAEFIADAANPFGIDAIRACIVDELEPGPVEVWGVDLAKSTDFTVAIGMNESGGVCAFQRWQSDWRNTRARIAAMIGGAGALVDSTGVGDPIVEDLQATCPGVKGYKFTRASKQQLFEGLALAIQRGDIRIPAGVIQHELEAFRYEYTPTGVRYCAPEGMHDDCADALALAVSRWSEMGSTVRIRVPGEPIEVWDGIGISPEAEERMWHTVA